MRGSEKSDMPITRHDVTMLLYNFGVVLSGGYVISEYGVGLNDRPVLLGISFMFAIVWTVYFKFSMVRRFVDHPELVEKIEGNGDSN